ncbi:Vacuolar membrane protease [Phlyctochytrium planicorne]|nr:Vacuolar membrane protease [Phlyctochytrium planicorne]
MHSSILTFLENGEHSTTELDLIKVDLACDAFLPGFKCTIPLIQNTPYERIPTETRLNMLRVFVKLKSRSTKLVPIVIEVLTALYFTGFTYSGAETSSLLEECLRHMVNAIERSVPSAKLLRAILKGNPELVLNSPDQTLQILQTVLNASESSDVKAEVCSIICDLASAIVCKDSTVPHAELLQDATLSNLMTLWSVALKQSDFRVRSAIFEAIADLPEQTLSFWMNESTILMLIDCLCRERLEDNEKCQSNGLRGAGGCFSNLGDDFLEVEREGLVKQAVMAIMKTLKSGPFKSILRNNSLVAKAQWRKEFIDCLLGVCQSSPNLKVRIHAANAFRQITTIECLGSRTEIDTISKNLDDCISSVENTKDSKFQELQYQKQFLTELYAIKEQFEEISKTSEEYTVPKLQEELRRRKLPEFGKKAILIERLETFEGISRPPADEDKAPSPRERKRKELSRLRSALSVWTAPFQIFKYFLLYLGSAIKDGLVAFFRQRVARKQRRCGLGTGLHTFVLFLGPHIAHVTMAAYKCGSLDFEDRGPHRFICPTSGVGQEAVTIWRIFAKIRLESFFWGLGTAIGELPPYFVARAAAIAGKDDADFNSVERILEKDPAERSVMERGQIAIYEVVQKLGFFGIVLCASIPNPLFDLAGIICGHFGVSFMTFFGATFVGKACVKNFVQGFAIIVLFSEEILAVILSRLKVSLPWLHSIVQSFLDAQVRQFKKGADSADTEKEQAAMPANIISTVWNTILGGMILYFMLSLVEALALQELKRRHDLELKDEGSSSSKKTE